MRPRSLLAPAAGALILTIIVLVASAPGASAQSWTAPATLSTCGPATAPKVAFAFKSPLRRVRDGAIVWLGLSPSCTDVGTGKTSVDIAALGSADLPGTPSAFTAGKAAEVGLLAPLSATITAHGKIVVIAGSSTLSTLGSPAGVFGEGYATGTFRSLKPVAGPADLVATATGVIGDSDIASVIVTARGQHFILLRAQRHYAHAFAAPYVLPTGAGPITALALGMDFRADTIVVWAQDGEIWARWVSNVGALGPRQLLGPSGFAPQISAVLSDDNRSFVIWSDEPAPGVAGLTRIYLDHSAPGPIFHGASVLSAYSEPSDVRLRPGALALVRLSGEGVVAVWPTLLGGFYVVDAGSVDTPQLRNPSVLSEPSQDVRLGAIAAGPRNDVAVLVEVAPRLSNGWDATQQQILATRSNQTPGPGLGFAPLSELTSPGTNSAPSIAIDPDSDVAVAAWQSALFGVPSVQWSDSSPGG
jgi:hypothetical protein